MCVSGALPPWLQDDPLEGTSGAAAQPEIGPSIQGFLKHSKKHTELNHFCLLSLSRHCIDQTVVFLTDPMIKKNTYLTKTSVVLLIFSHFIFILEEQEKLRKLPPNRVGANFDHSSQTDANWLPSFGRVWNSGRRWQSR